MSARACYRRGVSTSRRRIARGIRRSGLSWLAVALAAGFSVAATHDYLAWQRVRWDAVEWLTSEGVAPESIAGGFEVDHTTGARDGLETNRDKGPWYVALGPFGGAREVRRFAVPSWLPWSVDAVLVLHREK